MYYCSGRNKKYLIFLCKYAIIATIKYSYYSNRCTKCKEKIHLSGGQIMAISLFEHNETAYFAALSMMKNTGKAAIVYPTGTGKAFMQKKSEKV